MITTGKGLLGWKFLRVQVASEEGALSQRTVLHLETPLFPWALTCDLCLSLFTLNREEAGGNNKVEGQNQDLETERISTGLSNGHGQALIAAITTLLPPKLIRTVDGPEATHHAAGFCCSFSGGLCS